MHFPTPDLSSVEPSIAFHTEDIDLPSEISLDIWQEWIPKIIQSSGCQLISLTYIFCSDTYLHRINVEYLQHDTLTDIITFPYQEPPLIEGDIFISLDRVRENAQTLAEPFARELARVVIHGVLHLCGQGDKTPEQAAAMRRREEEALALLF